MLALWKRRHFFEPLRSDCVISRSDGVDLNAVCEDEMRRWYLDMLANAPAGMLAPADIAKSAAVTRSPTGTALVALGENVVRVLGVRLAGWERGARIVEAGSAEAQRQQNMFARGGISAPVAVLHENRTLELFTPADTSGTLLLSYLLVVQDTGPETYVLDERGFAAME